MGRCHLPKGKKTVGCRWVFLIKYKANEFIDRYKDHFVPKDYTPTYGVDYSETFSPVTKINTICVIFWNAANKDRPFHQFDVKNYFLHGEIEEVYIKAPPSFSKDYKPRERCRLRKAL